MTKLSRTSNSFYSQNYSPNKLNFQTKFKIRGTNQFLQKSNLNQKINNIEKSSPASSRNQFVNQSLYNPRVYNDQFSQSSKLLTSMNFSHHDSDKCLCNECLCGRHQCKLHVVKPDLKKSSTYMSNFRRAKSIRNQRIQQKQQNKSLPKVQMSSTYAFSFKNKDSIHIVKHHPKDQLIFEGPSQKLTSYKINYPGNRGSNPYVRPKQLFASGQFPLKNKRSAYRQSYTNFFHSGKNQSGKINDQLKTGTMNCFKQSFYQQKFRNPNPQDYNPIFKNRQKLQINPNYTHQYESIYDQEFIPTQTAVCPAKIKMETTFKDTLLNSKNSFNQNSDFKAFSSTYHALSMAPPRQF